ncbi:MAG: hypothetical protein ABIY55_24585 [Kofleriaceae bacterium]
MKIPIGVWQRDWVRRNGGPSDRATMVRYVQTPSAFGDLRIPEALPDLTGQSSLADLSDEQLLALAQQNGFAGTTTVSGANATWHHDIDFQPTSKEPDVGRIEELGPGKMFEHALDDSYVESWSVLDPRAGAFAVRVERDDHVLFVLAVSGQHFMYARARKRTLPPGKSLVELIARTRPERAVIMQYLDCEISYGNTHGWWIESSTLPWLQGKRLAFADRIGIGGDGQPLATSPLHGETWTFPVNTLEPDELQTLFAPTR